MGEALYEQLVARAAWTVPVPHLRAGGHARDAARLPGAPAAGERREHLVRPPPCRRALDIAALAADPRASVRGLGGAPQPRHRAAPGAVSRPRANSRGVDLPNEHALHGSRPGCATRRASRSSPRLIEGRAGGDADAAPRPQPRRPPRTCGLRRRGFAARHRSGARVRATRARGLGGADRRRARRGCLRARRRPDGGAHRDASRASACTKPARRSATRSPRCARPSTSAATTPPEAQTLRSPPAAPLGPVVCISPWNFPLAIFTGQVAAALAAGNPVLAKPAEQTPLVALAAVRAAARGGRAARRAAAACPAPASRWARACSPDPRIAA